MRLLPVPGVFQPCRDSWMLIERISRERLEPGASVLDLCTGSGAVAAAAARIHGAEVVAVDVSRRAVLATRLNATLNAVRVRALHGDLFAPVRGERFHLILSNPPYLPGSASETPRRGPARAWEGGADGRCLIDRICAQAAEHLHPGGVLLLVHSSVSGEQATVAALSRRGLDTSVVARERGRLGPRLRSRAPWLRERGLLAPDGTEDLLVIRARREDGRG